MISYDFETNDLSNIKIMYIDDHDNINLRSLMVQDSILPIMNNDWRLIVEYINESKQSSIIHIHKNTNIIMLMNMLSKIYKQGSFDGIEHINDDLFKVIIE